MKTAISMPDATFHRVTQTASRLGISRSELLTKAAEGYLDELESDALSEEINRAVDIIGDTDDSAQFAVEASNAHLRSLNDDW